jgi:hypothetical protein
MEDNPMAVSLSELLEENSLISDITDKHREFKQLHKQISEFSIENLLSQIEESKKPVQLKPGIARETDNIVLYAKDIVSRYQNGDLHPSGSDAKASMIKEAIRYYASELPELINRSYNFFKKAKSDKEREANNFAENFIDYCNAGRRYWIKPWFRWFKLYNARKFTESFDAKERSVFLGIKDKIASDTAEIEKEHSKLDSPNLPYIFISRLPCLKSANTDVYNSYLDNKYLKPIVDKYRLSVLNLKEKAAKLIREGEKKPEEKAAKEAPAEKIIYPASKSSGEFCWNEFKKAQEPSEDMYELKRIISGKDMEGSSWNKRLIALKRKLALIDPVKNPEDLYYLKTAQKALEESVEKGPLSELLKYGGIREKLVYSAVSCLKNYVQNSEASLALECLVA